MSRVRALRALVTERLEAAAEEISCVVEGRMLQTSDMSPEQQRAFFHQRLSAVADEIFTILEVMVSHCEADVSRVHDNDVDQQQLLLDITLKTKTHLHTPGAAGKKERRASGKVHPSDKGQATGRSCCRVCGKFFRYRRSFLKHVLKHEQSTDVCGVCGKHLDWKESLKLHLQTHNEENSCREQTDDRGEPKAEGSDGDSDEEWKESEGSDGESDETRGGKTDQSKGSEEQRG
ncbi:hypothetical protein INR49_029498 [Caranx melampygus]|nr:hypothetical protein INR49_029498 [Caranx melampygus]